MVFLYYNKFYVIFINTLFLLFFDTCIDILLKFLVYSFLES